MGTYLQSRREEDAAEAHDEEEQEGVHDPRRGRVLAGGDAGAAEPEGGRPAAHGQRPQGDDRPHPAIEKYLKQRK